MKRFAGWLAMSGAVPVAVFFVLMARPARLFAETGVAPSMCADPNVESCADASANDPCVYTYGNDASTMVNAFCHPASCWADGGEISSALQCEVAIACVTQAAVDDCAGKTLGESCGDGGSCFSERCPIVDGGAWDGGSMLACVAVAPPIGLEAGAEAGTGAEPRETMQGCSCDVTGSPASAAGSLVGLLGVMVALARRSAKAAARTRDEPRDDA